MHDKETKYKAIIHYKHFLPSLRKVGQIYGVSKSSLQRWLKADGGGQVVKKPKKKQCVKKEIADCITRCLQANPRQQAATTIPSATASGGQPCYPQKSPPARTCWRSRHLVRQRVTRCADDGGNTGLRRPSARGRATELWPIPKDSFPPVHCPESAFCMTTDHDGELWPISKDLLPSVHCPRVGHVFQAPNSVPQKHVPDCIAAGRQPQDSRRQCSRAECQAASE